MEYILFNIQQHNNLSQLFLLVHIILSPIPHTQQQPFSMVHIQYETLL
jgi:hypothetical protein